MKNYLVVLLVFFVAVGIFAPVDGFTFGFLSRYEAVTGNNGEVRIDIKEVTDGKAHYYSYEDAEKIIKFFVVKSPDGIIRAAFDACDVCFPAKKGYIQEGDFMICKNCGRKFHSNRINVVEGGCNPAPLERTQDGAHLVIRVADILQGGRYF